MSAFLPAYHQAVDFRPEQFNPVLLAGDSQMRVLLVCFEPEQFIPLHQPGIALALLVLEGEGRLIAGDREEGLRPGAVAFISAGEARGIQADTRMVVLQVVSPPPVEADHAEVVRRLREGTWR